MGDILEQKGWDSSECVELNIWAHIFIGRMEKFDRDRVESLGKPLQELFKTIAELRHTAVHRLRVTARRLEEFMTDAEQLTTLLDNDACVQILSQMRREVKSIVDELGRNKDLLESRLAEQLKDIACRRAELDQLEREAVEELIREDKDYQDLAGANLEETIVTPKNTVPSLMVSQNETGSEADDADSESFDEARIGQ